jgi:hypothetical protein
MSSTAGETTPWVKAALSDGSTSCVEMRRHAGAVEVRDTKDHGTGPILRYTATEFKTWLSGAKNGDFDHLLRG